MKLAGRVFINLMIVDLPVLLKLTLTLMLNPPTACLNCQLAQVELLKEQALVRVNPPSCDVSNKAELQNTKELTRARARVKALQAAVEVEAQKIQALAKLHMEAI